MSFNGWKEVTLDEISIGNKGNYGIGASAVEYSKNLYTYLRITDISDDGVLKKDSPMSVDDKESVNYLLKPNDIVFARTGNSTGRSYFYDGSDGELVYAGFLIKFSLDPSKVNPKFMRHYTLSKEYKNWVVSFSTGSTRGNINAKTYGNMKINLPPILQQDFLVKILSTLDEKIEVNNQINKTLENMAQTIFKKWFVDFEFPNEDGKPYKSSGGEMVESEFGMIPNGWEVKTTADICQATDYVANGSFASLKENVTYVNKEGGYAVLIRLVDYNRNFEDEYVWVDKRGYEFLKKSKLFGGEIIISNVGANAGTVFRVPKLGEKMTLGPNSIMLVPNNFSHFLYCFFISRYGQENLNGIRSGSAQPKFNKTAFRSIKLIVPIENILLKFSNLYDAMFDQMTIKEVETKLLKKTRDSLLPKLMSGEIRVPLDSEGESS
jgi:type I restriction enzyme S subunit